MCPTRAALLWSVHPIVWIFSPDQSYAGPYLDIGSHSDQESGTSAGCWAQYLQFLVKGALPFAKTFPPLHVIHQHIRLAITLEACKNMTIQCNWVEIKALPVSGQNVAIGFSSIMATWKKCFTAPTLRFEIAFALSVYTDQEIQSFSNTFKKCWPLIHLFLLPSWTAWRLVIVASNEALKPGCSLVKRTTQLR